MRFTKQFVIFSTIIFAYACNSTIVKVDKNTNSNYDFANPTIINLPDGLAEISGIVYYPKDTSVFAIEDEDGLFYKIYLTKNGLIKKWRFDKKHDFEDVVLQDSTFYVLISNGDIESLKFTTNDSILTSTSQFPDASKKSNEFESLYYDDSLKHFILFCKNCETDGKNSVSAWGYNLQTNAYNPEVYSLNVEPIAKKLGVDKIKIKPSATAINLITKELYILASIDHLLIVTDLQGHFKEVYQLNPSIYKQAEGIAFTPSGDLIISNESHQTGVANLLIIKNKKKGI
jgi:uncharacterized protein YjiK